jgi:hypothetical protein
MRTIFLLCAVLPLWVGWGMAATSNHVTQYGITWQFDHSYTVGQFANGDWWVLGPVTITTITPDYRTRDFWDFTAAQAKGVVFKKINGWQVNPVASDPQGFDGTLYEFDSTVVPGLPYLAQPGASIVKAVSDTNPATMDTRYQPDTRMQGVNNLLTAAVLTVVGAVPPDSGRTVFRPPYVGTDKPYYSTNNLHTELLPSLAPVTNTPTLAWVEEQFRRVQLNHKLGVIGALLRPAENMASPYQPTNAVRNDKGTLRLLLNDPLAQKMPALIYYVQYGIDIHYFAQGDPDWPGEGYGVEPGHKLPWVFAAVLLDDPAMKHMAGDTTRLKNDNKSIAFTSKGNVVWGDAETFTWAMSAQEASYWGYIIDPPTYNGANATDPYGYIDHSMTSEKMCDGYQVCCLSQPLKGGALTALLVPGMQAAWNHPAFFNYIDRWVHHGLLAQPDPCAPAEGIWQGGPQNGQRCTMAADLPGDTPKCIVDSTKYGVTYGPDPDRPGDCIRDTDPSDGIGRFPSRDGYSPDGGGVATYQDHNYRSSFVDYMWAAYRAGVPLANPRISPNGGAFSGVVDVTVVPDVSAWNPTLRYTIDGTDPTTSSPVYSGPVRLTASSTVKARAYFGSYAPSAVAQAAFVINADAQGPVITGIRTNSDSLRVVVVFNELLDTITAGQAANYTLNKGLTVLAAVISADQRTVILTTSAMQVDTMYTLTVNTVTDLSHNAIAVNTQKIFTFTGFDPAVGLGAYWSFNLDQGATATDHTGNGYNGTVAGAVWSPGYLGQGLKFTAVDTVKFPMERTGEHFGIPAAGACTYAFWVKVTGHTAAADDIISRAATGGPISIRTTSDRRIQTYFTRSSTPSILSSTAVLNDSLWYHVAVTYQRSDSSRVLYINGVRDEGGSNKIVASLNFPNMSITRFGGFNGVLDEVRIYPRALTARQIGYLYADSTDDVTALNDRPGKIAVDAQPCLLPNPAYNLKILRANSSLYRLYSLSGRPVAINAVNTSGVYLLEIVSRRQVQKIVLLNK